MWLHSYLMYNFIAIAIHFIHIYTSVCHSQYIATYVPAWITYTFFTKTFPANNISKSYNAKKLVIIPQAAVLDKLSRM